MGINEDIDYVKKIIRDANYVLNVCAEEGRWEAEKGRVVSLLKKAFNAALSLCAKYSLATESENIRSTLAEASDLTQVEEYNDAGVYYLYWGSRLLSHLDIIEKLYGKDVIGEIPATLDLVVRIIRQAEYTMEALNKYPKNEREFDEFIENLLKAVYPDLLPTPTLPKPIKNFEPDTGIPSLQLLIEYKYLASNYFFIIYEQRRFVSEVEWNNLLQQCGTAKNTWVFVIPGVPLVT